MFTVEGFVVESSDSSRSSGHSDLSRLSCDFAKYIFDLRLSGIFQYVISILHVHVDVLVMNGIPAVFSSTVSSPYNP